MFSKDVIEFVNMQIDPSGAPPKRLPDGCATQTFLAQEMSMFEVQVYFTGTANDGKFALAWQPHLGGIDNVDDYKIAVADPSLGWPTDWSSSASYHNRISGYDPRISKYYQKLTQPDPSFLFAAGGGFVGTAPLGTTPAVVPLSNYGISPVFTVSGADTNTLALPPGQYFLNIEVSAVAGLTGLVVTTTAPSTVVQYQNMVTAAGDYEVWRGIWSCEESGSTLSIQSPTGTPTSSNIQGSPTFTPILDTVSDFGDILQYRPVAGSVLATSVLPPLLAGGMISAAWVPGETMDDRYFVSNSVQNTGDLHEWSALGTVPGAYSGKFEMGAYTFWSYEDTDDWQFYRPSRALDNAYPGLLISGQVQPQAVGGALPSPLLAIRFVCTTVYEIETLNRLYAIDRCVGSSSAFADAMELIRLQPSSMMNDEHRTFVQNVMQKLRGAVGNIRKFFENNKSWIVPLGGAAAKLALAL